MGTYWERDGEPGEMVECTSCHGWNASETGAWCAACEGEGFVWQPLPDDEHGDIAAMADLHDTMEQD